MTGGYPGQVRLGGTQGGVPPPARSDKGGTPVRPHRGDPRLGTPKSGWGGTQGGVTPRQGWCTRLARSGWGGGEYRTADGVLDTPWSVCLLRSRRKTFLLLLAIERTQKVKYAYLKSNEHLLIYSIIIQISDNVHPCSWF